MPQPQPQVPTTVRLRLGHAAVQWLADEVGADLLHIKGEALDPALRHPGRQGSDIDVLVRPAHVERLLRALDRAGWARLDRFSTGSPFEHATTLQHSQWGYVDVHRAFPGIGPDPATGFDVLWAGRGSADIAGRPCPVPDTTAQALILLAHAARAPAIGRRADVTAMWLDRDEGHRAAVRALAVRLDAELPLALAVGEDVARFAGRRDYDLWLAVSRGASRRTEWRARIRAADSPRDKASLVLRSVLPNTDALAIRIGRAPTRGEVLRETLDRLRRGVRRT